MSLAAPERFQGLDRFEARKRVVAELEALGLLEKVENHRHAVGHCYRCDTVVEPRLSDQWFVRMEPLARPALAALPRRDAPVHPRAPGRRLRPLAREHPRLVHLPAALVGPPHPGVVLRGRAAAAQVSVSRTDLTACPGCGGAGAPGRGRARHLVLLLAGAVLQPRLARARPPTSPRYYPGPHPGHRARDPLLLGRADDHGRAASSWARCRSPGCTSTAPCATPSTARCPSRSATGSIRSRWCERYGADALRYTLVSGMSVGHRRHPRSRTTSRRSFAPGPQLRQQAVERGPLHPLQPRRPGPAARRAARRTSCGARSSPWPTAGSSRAATRPCARPPRRYERFRLNEAAAAVYRFIWSDLADWYIEQIKPRLYGDAPGGDVARAVAAQTFDVALRLLHPVMPFVTETLWQRLPGPAEPTPRSRSRPGPGPTAGRRIPRRCASSGWCRRSWARSARSAPSTACSRASRCARW